LNEGNLGKRLEVDREIHPLTNLHEKVSRKVEKYGENTLLNIL